MTDRQRFTPGPWRVPQCCTIHMDKPSWDENYSPLVKSGKEVVCGLINVRVADAALIATAPEMYARLEQVAEDFEALGLTSNRDSVLRLLSKARGENNDATNT